MSDKKEKDGQTDIFFGGCQVSWTLTTKRDVDKSKTSGNINKRETLFELCMILNFVVHDVCDQCM